MRPLSTPFRFAIDDDNLPVRREQLRARSPEIERLGQQIGKSVDALGAMFDDLLDISRLDAGIIEPRCQHFHLHDLFDRLYVDFAALAQDKGMLLSMPSGDECDAVIACRKIRRRWT